MTLHYTPSYGDLVDYYDALTPNPLPDSGRYHVRLLIINALVLTCAFLCAISSELIMVAMLLVAIVLFDLSQSLPYSKFRRLIIERQAASAPKLPTSLEFLEDGLRETVEGVVSFVPWSSISRIYRIKGIVVADLSTGQYALIPCSILSQQKKTPEDIITLVESRLPKSTV